MACIWVCLVCGRHLVGTKDHVAERSKEHPDCSETSDNKKAMHFFEAKKLLNKATISLPNVAAPPPPPPPSQLLYSNAMFSAAGMSTYRVNYKRIVESLLLNKMIFRKFQAKLQNVAIHSLKMLTRKEFSRRKKRKHCYSIRTDTTRIYK